MCPEVENVRSIDGGVPFVVQLDEVAARKKLESAENRPAKDKLHAQITGVMPSEHKKKEA